VALDEARAPEKGFPRLGQVWPATQLALALGAVAMATLGGEAIGLLTHGKFTQAYIFATLWLAFVMFENASKPAVAIMYAYNLGVANQRIALLAGVASVALMIPLVAWFGPYGAIATNFAGVSIYRGLIVVAARRAAPFPFQDGTLFFGMAVVLVTLTVIVAMGPGLGVRLGILALSSATLVVFCKSARQSTALALKTMLA
jgi:O-antigen/teichoic acid export membrane protein